MIATTIDTIARYKGLGTHLDIAIDWLLDTPWDTHEGDGRVDIDGDNVYALYQSYQSKTFEDARFETHKVYIDIQVLISGEEEIHVRSSEGLYVDTPYVVDIEFQKNPEPYDAHICVMKPKQPLILFPEDAHKPGVQRNKKVTSCRKVVLKVKLG